MTVECSQCKSFVCRQGRTDSPTENCPMLGDFPAFEDLYQTPELKRNAYHAARVEAEGYCEWTRLREVAEYASKLGVERLGVAHWVDTGREATLAARYFEQRSLLPLLPPHSATQAPLEQVGFFAEQGTQLNVVVGMPVVQEALFISASETPVVVLVARDTRLFHNPAGALYTSGSYSRERLFGDRDTAEWSPFQGVGIEALGRASATMAEQNRVELNRLQEAMVFARVLGVKHIGISFCTGFQNEARLLTGVLAGNGFQVSSVCCKAGAEPKALIGIEESEQVRPGQPEMICNPLAQAELLTRDEVQLVMSLGQCVGHDAATLGSLNVPAFCIVAKDRVLAHNPVVALYRLESTSDTDACT